MAKVEIDGVMWRKHQWLCAMRSFLTMSHVYPEVWHMLQTVTKECERVKALNRKAEDERKKEESRRFFEENEKRTVAVEDLNREGKTQEALALQKQPPFDPERATLLERLESWSTAASETSGPSNVPLTMMVMRHRGSMPRHARLLPRA
jgi:hypothetical protein